MTKYTIVKNPIIVDKASNIAVTEETLGLCGTVGMACGIGTTLVALVTMPIGEKLYDVTKSGVKKVVDVTADKRANVKDKVNEKVDKIKNADIIKRFGKKAEKVAEDAEELYEDLEELVEDLDDPEELVDNPSEVEAIIMNDAKVAFEEALKEEENNNNDDTTEEE